MNSFYRELVFWTWCLPQTLLGAILFVVLKRQKKIIDVRKYKQVTLVKVTDSKAMGGISLGRFNFLTVRSYDENSKRHEYGHTIQGFIFGPLYLIAIGIPSEFWLVLSHFSKHINETYYTRYPENWASTLGGVQTTQKNKKI